MTKQTDAAFRRAGRRLLSALLALSSASPAALAADSVTITETFKETTASGWTFGGTGYTPVLTANTVDSAGDGWLRLTSGTNGTNRIANQSTYALFDTELFSVNAQIQIEIEYAFYNGGNENDVGHGAGFPFAEGAVGDGITFFLVDGSVDASTFSAGAYGGSLGYANMNSTAGMSGGYLGFGFDNFGNYAAANEGKEGGVDISTQGTVSNGLSVGDRDADYSNVIGVRGPESSDYAYIDSSGDLRDIANGGSMYVDTPNGQRPDQDGANYRSFRLTLDANNQLLVEMKFGVSGPWVTAFTADLSTFERPETFKIGFTAGTGGAWSTQEVRNVEVTTTPWSSGSGAYEWDNGDGTTAWGATPGDPNTNWYAADSGSDNLTPVAGADVLFGDKPTNNGPTNSQQVALSSDVNVRNLTIDSHINYSIGSVGDGHTLTFGNTTQAGLPSINVNNYNGAHARHKINSDILLIEKIAIQNYSASILCLNGTFDTAGHSVTVNGTGAVNFNGSLLGSGDLFKNGSGITTINANNAATWTGGATINGGQLVVTIDGALGDVGTAGTPGTPGDPGVSQSATTEYWWGNSQIQLAKSHVPPGGIWVGMAVSGSVIPDGTTILSYYDNGGHYVITLSNMPTGSTWDSDIDNWGTVNYHSVAPTPGTPGTPSSGATTVNSGGTLTFRGGVNYATQEKLTIAGQGHEYTPGKHLGAIYNDGGDNSFAGPITLAADAAVGSRDGTLTLSGPITGGAGKTFTKLGAGTVALTGSTAGLWDGAFAIEEGALRLNATSFNIAMNYQLAGGVLEIAGDFDTDSYIAATSHLSISLGDGNYEIQWTGDGGFSAHGANRSIYLNWNADSLTWGGTQYFVGDGHALLFGSKTSTHTATLMNGINFNGAQREVRVADGSATVDGALAGALTGTGGLVKTGDGTLALTSAGNTYSGATEIRAGALRGNVSANSNLQLNGGVRELNGNYTGDLGASGGQMRWIAGGGGLAADTTARTFNVGNNGQTLAWAGSTGNSQYFVREGDELVLGSRSTAGTLTFANAIDLNGAERTLRVLDSSASPSLREAVLSGALSNGSVVFAGDGDIALTANSSALAGSVTVRGADLTLEGANGALAAASGYTVEQGGVLTLNNNDNLNTNRLANTGSVVLDGGTLSIIGRAANNQVLNETVGTVVLSSGSANTINVERRDTHPNGRNRLSAAALTREAGATVDFTNANGQGTFGGGVNSDNPTVTFTSAPSAEQGILAYATVNGAGSTPAFAGYDATNGIVRVAGTNTGQASWTASTIATNTTDQTLDTTDLTVGALSLGSGIDVTESGGSRTLTVQTGGILATGATVSNLSVSNLQVGGTGDRELVTHVYGAGGLNISSSIRDNGNTTGLTKSGDGTLTLSGSAANTHTGVTTVNAGTLVLAKSAGLDAVAGDLVIGDGRGIDTVRLAANEQIANTATVTLRGGELGNSANVARLEMNGAANDTFGSRVERFASLNIEGNTVLDFGGGTPCAPTFLYLDVLNIASDALLTITNWIEFTDFLLVKKTTFDSEDLGRVVFDGYDDAASWKDYDSDYYQIVPYAPVPEPASAGLLALGGLTGCALLRRPRRA